MQSPPGIILWYELQWAFAISIIIVSIIGIQEVWALLEYLWSRVPLGLKSFLTRVAAWFAANRLAQYMTFVVILLLALCLGLACIWRFVLGAGGAPKSFSP